ncbi:MAG: TonB-dependent receptor domain-containing protein [bacterium]
MRKNSLYILYLIIGMNLLIGGLYPSAPSAETGEQWAARIVSVQGSVEVRRSGETQWQPVTLNDTYYPGDVIRVKERSRAELALINDPILRLDENSTIILGGLQEERSSLIDLLKGAVYFFSRFPRSLEVHTTFVNAGVEGTEFLMRVEEDKTLLSIFEGKVVASNDVGRITLTSGQSAVAEEGKEPSATVVVRPRDAVQWALYYPSVIYFHPDEFHGTSARAIEKSIQFYLRGDLQKSFESIEEVLDDILDPRFFIWRASLLLSVGRVFEASADIKRALTLDSKYSNAFALQSIIEVVQNEKDKALSLAQEAVLLDPESAAAHIALSYAQQSHFDLQGALASLRNAIRCEPENALAWARLAELQLSFGNLDKALESAKKAVTLSPTLSRTQMVLGFAYLAQVKTEKAQEAFTRASECDQAAPLPMLGLGLAKIREGDLPEGRRQIEIAVCLDPDNSLIRSYLGKAYFEEKRDKEASDQYIMAEKFDPSDPTHFFYNAIRKQSVNRPVEALRDLHKAIELNDNRAVYRSRLLLDSDLAARSASLARIYKDLGFEQLALIEGWKSVNIDPANFSAHRFLADSYSVLPRHEIARVSELLQSQLLQPLNIAPIQPRLAESNLFLMSSGGPMDLSFNEFNRLFNKDKNAFHTSGFAGEHHTNGEEVVLSGIYKKASYSVGGVHLETEGFRENNDQDDDIYNAFVQMELSYKTSIQAECRYRNTQNGDLELKFLSDDFKPNWREEKETASYRIGFRHSFSPGSILLASFMYHDIDCQLQDEPTVPFIDSINTKINENSMSSEFQHLCCLKHMSIISGVGYFNINGKDETTTELNFPPPPIGPGPSTNFQLSDRDVEHTNLYIYSHISSLKNVTLTIGSSADFFDSERSNTVDRDQVNPKLGITWHPLPVTTFRAAVFRILKRTLIADQTLEPTQVAGFNQFFDDPDSTDSWRYSGAIDQKFSQNLYGGVEFFQRHLHVHYKSLRGTPPDRYTVCQIVDWQEYLGRAHLFWTPYAWVAFSGEYLYERFERDEEYTLGIKEVTTHRIPLGINFFCGSGLSTSLKATYFNQDGDFAPQNADPGTFEHGEDHFWIVDAAFSYRLPKRYGLITVGATNLFDEDFRYQETDIDNPIIQPDRTFFARVTLAF